ncbi:MAG TPA: alpha/beta hydrolase [Tepidisphaeraceae bacterium]|jgi:pimeloyl-ACP methyl ester carboxylesterase
MATQTVRGVTFHFHDRGKGLPLVLVHGFPLDSRMWDAPVSELSSDFRTIAPDLRGFGQTHASDPFTMESMADDLHALLERIGALPCVLAGLSMGGYIALAYVRKYPADLRGLMLIDTKAEGDTAEQKEGRQKTIDLVRSQGAKAVAEQMLPKMLAEETPKRRPAVAQALRGLMEACPPKTIEHALLAMRDRPDQSSNLSSIAMPTLIIVGDHDAITPVAIAQSLQKQIPHAQLVVITGAGHMAPMEQPAQVNQAMARFLHSLP